MFIPTSKDAFFPEYLTKTGVVLTGNITECKNFGGKCYVDEQHRYIMLIDYGYGDVVTVAQPFDEDLHAAVVSEFPDTVSIQYIYNGYIGRETADLVSKEKIYYRYRYQGARDSESTPELPFTIKTLTTDDTGLAARYDELYFSALPERHGARHTNILAWSAGESESGKHKLYYAMIGETPVGFIYTDYFPEFRACDFGQLTIEEAYRKRGFGAAFLSAVARENAAVGYDAYYTTVDEENIASRSTAEKAGFAVASSLVGINLKPIP